MLLDGSPLFSGDDYGTIETLSRDCPVVEDDPINVK